MNTTEEKSVTNGEDTRQLGERMATILRDLQRRSGVVYSNAAVIVRDSSGAISAVSLRTRGKQDRKAPDAASWEELQREAQRALAELLATHEAGTGMSFGVDFQIEREGKSSEIRKVTIMYDALN
ncbi:MAG: hypothetical protein KBI44_06040 [Thermoanaerobaculia bacterium]|nr:hypothetical protein [Thermoanaerobaculia bacterium]